MIVDRKSIRPKIKEINTTVNKTVEEKYQNQILRPIIKLQHDLLLAYFQAYLIKINCQFDQLSELKKKQFIAAVFKQDNTFKSELKGIVIGQFTTEEFAIYYERRSDLNKRILAMIEQRISSVIIFQTP